MDLYEASKQAKLDPFARYTGAVAKMVSTTGKLFWLIWINEEDDPIVHRWFPHSDVDIPSTEDLQLQAEVYGFHVSGAEDWQPASDTSNDVFRQYIDSRLLWLTFRDD